MASSLLKVRIIDPKQILFEGEVSHLLVPSAKGMLGIFPNHTPLYAEITTGTIELAGSTPQTFDVVAGIIKVRKDSVTLLIGI